MLTLREILSGGESKFYSEFLPSIYIMELLQKSLLGILVAVMNILPAHSQCGSIPYDIETRGLPDTDPQPFQAWQGLPFFPELETDNRKYFQLNSGTDVAIYLHSSSQIINQDTDEYYQIVLEQNGMVTISRGTTEKASAPYPNLLPSSDDFYVEVSQSDATIHVGRRNNGELLSWKDTTLIDVNYILVQKYNDLVGSTSLWKFCEGELKLLSQNQIPDKMAEAADRNDDSTNYRDEGKADKAIDGKTNEGLFDEEYCQIMDHHYEDDDTLNEHNWWRVDLKDMYDIKAVTMMNGQDYLCPRNRRDWHYYGSACYFVGTTPMTWFDAETDCNSYGGNLAWVTVPAISDFLKQWLEGSTDDYWIGLTDDMAGTGNWYWRGYTPTVYDEYTDWHASQPTTVFGTDCTRMAANAQLQWWTDNCDTSTEQYICQVPQCDTGWVLFGTTCYYFSTTTATYTDARDACHSDTLRGELATVNSTYIHDFFGDHLNAVTIPYWMGLISGNGDYWYWDAYGVSEVIFDYSALGAGEDGFAVDNAFQAFADGEPDNDGDYCGAWYFDWFDNNCGATYPYICERLPTIPEQLEDAEVRIGSCGPVSPAATTLNDIKLHDECVTPIDTSEVNQVRAGYWLFRQCEENQFGQYVYILKESTNADVTWFSLCEVEVWGVELTDAQRPKIGFTQEVVTNLEDDFGSVSVSVTKTGGSAEHPTCFSYTLGLIEITAEDAGTPDDYDHDAILGTPVLPGTDGQRFLPTGPFTYTFTVDVNVDTVQEDDEEFYFFIDTTSPGLLVEDSTEPTYETVTFTIQDDDDIMTDIDTTGGAVMATADEDYQSLPSGTAVVFGPNEVSKNVEITLFDDDSCEIDSTMDETFRIILEAASEGNLCDTADVNDDYVIATILHDDAIFSFQVLSFPVEESVGEFEVVVERNGYVGVASTIGVKTEPETPTESASTDDYTAFERVITIPVGRTTESVTVVIEDDNMVEEDMETFDLILVKNPTSLPDCVLDPANTVAEVIITDDDCVWSITSSDMMVYEQAGPITVTFTCVRPDTSLLSPLTRPVTATFVVNSEGAATGDGAFPATAAVDFVRSTLTSVTILAGETTATKTIDILDDEIYEESDEFFDVILQASSDGEIEDPSSIRIKIIDDDVVVRISSCEGTTNVLESGDTYTVSLERTGFLMRPDSILLDTQAGNASPGSDYTDVEVVISFTSGQQTAHQDIIIIDDNDHEPDETFTVYIVKHRHETYIDPAADTCQVTILDDDCTFKFSVSEDDLIVTEAVGGVTIPVTISRGGNIGRAASIVFSTSPINDGQPEHYASPSDDFVPVSKTLNFDTNEDTKTETIQILDDDKPEVREFFQIGITNADCSIDRGDGIVIGIEDNDEVIILMREESVTVDESVGYATVTLLRTGSLARTDTVTLRLIPQAVPGTSRPATPNSDYQDGDITVEFGVDEDEKIARIQIYNDTIEEPSLESFVLRISSVSRQGQGSSVLDASIDNENREAVVYVRDDDGTFQLVSTSRRVSESVGSITIIVERTGPALVRQTAYLSTSEGSASSPADYQGLSGEALIFDPNVKTKSYTLRITDDQEAESSEDFFIYLSTDLGNDLGQRVELVTIEDNDNQIKFIATPGTDSTATSVSAIESDRTVRVSVQRSGFGSTLPSGLTSVRVSSRLITVNELNVDSANQTDFTRVNTILNYQPGQSRQDVVIAIMDDEIKERTEAFELYLSDPAPSGSNSIIYPSTIMVYIMDDDGGLPDIVDTPDGDSGSGNAGGTNLDTAAIVGIGGGLGLLLLLGVLGLVACVGLSRMQGNATTGASLPLAGPPRGRPPPPAYYRTNPAGVQLGGSSRGPTRVVRY